MNQKCYISRENKIAYDKLTEDGYELTEGIKEYHPKHSENWAIRPIIGIAEVYWVEYTGTQKEFNKYMDDNNLRLHKQNGLRKESIKKRKRYKNI